MFRSNLFYILPILCLFGCGGGNSANQPPDLPMVNPPPVKPASIPKPVPPVRPVETETEEPDDLAVEPGEAPFILSPLPEHHEKRLEIAGIQKIESEYLTLFTDLPLEKVRDITRLIDLLYVELEEYFGELPEDENGDFFHMYGYLMDDKGRFERAGVIPRDLPPFSTGRHRGREFWVLNQEWDYYRRHLVLHEATHCFMTALPNSEGPAWYMEGMAELFATHRLGVIGGAEFRVMPDLPEDFEGWSRIQLLQNSRLSGAFQSIDQIRQYRFEDFEQNDRYAWSWALCTLLDQHPRYRDRFHELGDPAKRANFFDEFNATFISEAFQLVTEWELFATHLDYGYDIAGAAVEFGNYQLVGIIPPPMEPKPEIEEEEEESDEQDEAEEDIESAVSPIIVPPQIRSTDEGEELPIEVAAERGWQTAEFVVQQGEGYHILATGETSLANDPVPWISEPQGITFRYIDGRPLGELHLAVLVGPNASLDDPSRPRGNGLLDPIPVGPDLNFSAPVTGTLFFRVNDAWNELLDNSGKITISVTEGFGSGTPLDLEETE